MIPAIQALGFAIHLIQDVNLIDVFWVIVGFFVTIFGYVCLGVAVAAICGGWILLVLVVFLGLAILELAFQIRHLFVIKRNVDKYVSFVERSKLKKMKKRRTGFITIYENTPYFMHFYTVAGKDKKYIVEVLNGHYNTPPLVYVDGKRVVRKSTTIGFGWIEFEYTLNKDTVVSVRKNRKVPFRGIRPHTYRVFLNGKRVCTFDRKAWLTF